MLCDAMCDAGGPNQLADHHCKSGTLDSPWHPDKGYPFKNAPFGAFFCLDFPALLAFMSGDKLVWGGQFLFHSERANPTQSRPMRQNHQKPLYDEIKNFFTQNSQS